MKKRVCIWLAFLSIFLYLGITNIGLWVQVLKVPYSILFPLIILFCLIGVYSIDYKAFDILMMIFFGIVGYLFTKLEYEQPAPLIMAFILGPMLGRSFRQSLIMSNGSLSIFFTRPIAGAAIGLAIALYASIVFGVFRKARVKVTEIQE